MGDGRRAKGGGRGLKRVFFGFSRKPGEDVVESLEGEDVLLYSLEGDSGLGEKWEEGRRTGRQGPANKPVRTQ